MDGDNLPVAESLGSSESLTNWGELIAGVESFHRLVPIAHKMAIAKGWWQDGIENRPMSEIIANFHAEVSEAWEEYRAGRMETWYAEGSAKPEGFWIKIADLLIRIADAVGAHREGMFETVSKYVDDISIPCFIVRLHVFIAARKDSVALCECFARLRKVDLYAVVRTKLAYNATRPYRHGGKKE